MNKKKNYQSKLISLKLKSYQKVKNKIINGYLKSQINDENMSFAYTLSKLLNIKDKLFISTKFCKSLFISCYRKIYIHIFM